MSDEIEKLFPTTDLDSLQIMASPHHVTMLCVTYIAGVGMSVRAGVVPGSSVEMFVQHTEGMDLCDCNPGMCWFLTSINPNTGRVIQTMTLDSHVAIAWMQSPQLVHELDLDGFDTTHEIIMVPEGEGLQTVLNEFAGWATGGLKMETLTDDDISAFFDNEEG